jgi:hypothetical protein
MSERLSIEHCSRILNKNGNKRTPEQVKAIRDFLYSLGAIEKESHTKTLTNEKRSSLHPGI